MGNDSKSLEKAEEPQAGPSLPNPADSRCSVDETMPAKADAVSWRRLFWVTLYCDASYSMEHGGAWSIWLRSDKGRIVRSGKCPPEVTDATAAELYAALRGIEIARDEMGAEAVQVNSDCSAVVSSMGKGYRWLGRKNLRQLQDRILRTGVKLRPKHVKAHTGKDDVRSYLNRRCDNLANRARKAEEVR